MDVEAFLCAAKEKMLHELELEQRKEQLSDEKIRLEKAIDSEKKAVESEITGTIKKRREEVAKTYDQETAQVREQLKKARSGREKKRAKGVRGRVEEETADLYLENGDIKRQIKAILKKDRVPGFCNTKLYYALYFMGGFADFIRMLVTFLICFVVVPFAIYFALPQRRSLYLALIYVGAVVVFGGLYMLILNETKVKHLHALREVKRLRKNIKNNEKRIALIRRGIKNDNDDSRYHLEEFDVEIDRLENLHEDVQERQKKALEEFEGNIKQGIQQEILQSAQETKDKLAHDYQVVKGDLVNLDHEQKVLKNEIADEYGKYLGEEFLNIEKVDALLEIVREKGVDSIHGAIDLYKNHAAE